MRMIAFEGLDASGKETQVNLLQQKLSDLGLITAVVSFPRYEAPIGELIKKGLKNDIVIDDMTLHMLLEADRQAEQGDLEQLSHLVDYIVLDRYTMSNTAYCKAKGIDIKWVENMQKYLKKPDLTFILDIPAEESFRRKHKLVGLSEMDKHELDTSLLKKVRQAYIDLAEDYNKRNERVVVIDATQSIEQIHREICKELGL